MTRNRRRKNKESGIWRWVSFIVFALILSLLIISIVKRQSPVKTIKMIVPERTQQDSLMAKSKTDLVGVIRQQESKIQKLQEQIEGLQQAFNAGKGKIVTSSDALNLRTKPSLGNNILMKIPNGSVVDILSYDSETVVLDGEEGRWCLIKYGSTEGWVWGNYVVEL